MKKKLILAQNILVGKDLELTKDSAIIIYNNIIEKIVKRDEIERMEDFEVIDLGDRTVFPGMIECHNHLCIDARIPDHLELLAYSSEAELTLISIQGLKDDLLSGVTTSRCMADKFNMDIKLKKKIADNTILGPDLITAGVGIKALHGAGYIGVPHSGIEEFRRTARKNLKNGADVLKIFATPGVAPIGQIFIPSYLSREEIATVVSEGQRLNVPTAAHCIGGQALRDCAEMGVAVIEHAYAATDEDVEILKTNGTWVDLTSGVYMDEEREKFLSIENVKKIKYHRKNVQKSLKRIVEGGVSFVIGTDANHGLLYKEIGFAIELGADIKTALKGITSNAAIVCGLENKIGSIAEGMIADIIAVKENPIDNWKTLSDVKFVMKQGKVYKKPKDCSVEIVKPGLN